MKKQQLNSKILVLGIDGMDPRLTRKYLDAGKLPNVAKFLERGVARKDLVMLGVLPTITPPSWTTLSTGAYPETHGITDFFRQSHEDLDTIFYNLDSRYCKAEQLWDVLAAEGKKTLVWHWPGSSWPPTSDNPNLHVVDGTNPEMINSSVAQKDGEKIIYASTKIESVSYKPKASHTIGAGCIITDLKLDDERLFAAGVTDSQKSIVNLILSIEENADEAVLKIAFDLVNSPIKDPSGWNNAPEGSREFTIISSNGLDRRPALILKNEDNAYDRIAIYRSKKDAEPYVVVQNTDEFSPIVFEQVTVEEESVICRRAFKILDMAPDGSEIRVWMSDALDIENDTLWRPKSLYQDVINKIGHIPCLNHGGYDPLIIEKLRQPSWRNYIKWQADALNYLIENQEYEVIFSHVHNVDMQMHYFTEFCKNREKWGNDEKIWQQFVENLYIDTDRYIGRFLHLLDEGWSIMILSDHALVVREEEETALLADPTGVMIPVMEELGYTVLKKDKDGRKIREIDWENTRAINPRGNFIWINLKGRNKTGIVDPKDKEELERKIIDDLYSYRDPRTGKRVVSMAMRNKDAVLVGLSGSETGDIIFFIEDGFVKGHGDGLSTCFGYADTSLSPAFMAAGKRFKNGTHVERVIREVDIAPTIAYLSGVRPPAHCEGGILHQLLDDSEL
ncbi:MAG: alkaline phosphatase family protein [Deltaproteobacteria bacterium]|nr:alkaline phosphatase family protein [Deltaproteobacteria bacterium]